MNEIEIIIEEKNTGERLDAVISKLYPNFSRNKIQKWIKENGIKINGESTKASLKVKTGDIIKLLPPIEPEVIIKPENINLDVRYEDDNMAIINKPKNMITHPTSLETENTLVNALLARFGENLSDLNGKMRPGIVHRLDRNTSGLLIIAKNNKAHEILSQRIKNKEIKRNYLAIVSGNIEQDSLTINKPIGRNANNPAKMAINEDGKPSVTHVKVLERFQGYTYIELELETGRTHQIRVHLSSIGHPIVNDSMYGGKKINVKTTEQVLQAYMLTFNNLEDNIETKVTLSPDEDLTKVLNYLRSKKV